MNQVTAKLNYLHIAPRKVRLVANAIKGLSVNEAEAQLLFRPQRASQPILKLLQSAVANAKNNQKMNPDKLVVESILVNQGPMLKRFMPRAMGRATPIQKKTSHLTIVIAEKEKVRAPRFMIAVSKKIKSSKESKTKTVKKSENKPEKFLEQKPKEKAGFFKKIFQRKSV